jgi:hypothetical protein
MDDMIGALLDDALVHPSHVILHSSLCFHKGHLLFMYRGLTKLEHNQE